MSTKKQLKFIEQKNKIIKKILKLNEKFKDRILFYQMEKELINFCKGQKYNLTIKKINEIIKKHKIILSVLKNTKKFFNNILKKLNKKSNKNVKKENKKNIEKKENKKNIEKKENKKNIEKNNEIKNEIENIMKQQQTKILAIEYNINEIKPCSDIQYIINNFGIEIDDTEEIINKKDNDYINYLFDNFQKSINDIKINYLNKLDEIQNIKFLYKKLSLMVHPDKNTKYSNLEIMKKISNNYSEFIKIIEVINKKEIERKEREERNKEELRKNPRICIDFLLIKNTFKKYVDDHINSLSDDDYNNINNLENYYDIMVGEIKIIIYKAARNIKDIDFIRDEEGTIINFGEENLNKLLNKKNNGIIKKIQNLLK